MQTILVSTIIQIDKHKVKYIITACIPIITINFYFFSLLYIRMNGKSITFDKKNIKKSDFYNKNKKIFNIDDIDVNNIQFLKKTNMVNIIHLNTLFGIMIMMLLDPYIYLFPKRLDILINLKKIK